MKILPTNNPTWGYAGELAREPKLTDWNTLSKFLVERYPSATPADVRNLLDSKVGRHLADVASFHGGNVIKAMDDKKTRRWIDREMADIKIAFDEA